MKLGQMAAWISESPGGEGPRLFVILLGVWQAVRVPRRTGLCALHLLGINPVVNVPAGPSQTPGLNPSANRMAPATNQRACAALSMAPSPPTLALAAGGTHRGRAGRGVASAVWRWVVAAAQGWGVETLVVHGAWDRTHPPTGTVPLLPLPARWGITEDSEAPRLWWLLWGFTSHSCNFSPRCFETQPQFF